MAAEKDYPQKLYYSISEVAKIAAVKAHVLRYWESEFPSLKPRKTRSGSRRYRPGDIDEVLTIKDLLYVQGFKIAGARKALRAGRQTAAATADASTQMSLEFSSMSDAERLAFIKAELGQIQELIRQLPGASTKGAGDKRRKLKEKG